MKNKSIGFVAALAAITVMTSGVTAFATETESVANVEVSTDIITEVIGGSTTNVIALDAPYLDVPVLAVAVAPDTEAQMEAQVILGDGTFSSSNRAAIEEKGDYTFVVSGLDMGKDDFGNIILTFDFAGSQLLGENVEDINIDITELKIGDVSFNVEGANFDKSKYDLGFRLFDVIKADEEAYANTFSEDGDTSGAEIRVNNLSVSIHVNTLKIDREEPPVTTSAPITTTTIVTTTVTTEASTTKPANPVTQPANTATAPNTTKATTTTAKPDTTTTTAKPNDGTTPPPTGDAGVGVAVATLTSSAAIAFIARKRKKQF